MFHKSTKTSHGYTTTCKECSIATVEYYYQKRKRFSPRDNSPEKKCVNCKKVKHRDISHIKRYVGWITKYVAPCQDKKALGHPKRKQKFIDAGCDVDKTCTHCKTLKSYCDFYLVTPDPSNNPEIKFATKVCRECAMCLWKHLD